MVAWNFSNGKLNILQKVHGSFNCCLICHCPLSISVAKAKSACCNSIFSGRKTATIIFFIGMLNIWEGAPQCQVTHPHHQAGCLWWQQAGASWHPLFWDTMLEQQGSRCVWEVNKEDTFLGIWFEP